MTDQDTERPQTLTTRFGARSRSPSFGEAIEKPTALSPDETQLENSGSPLDEENSTFGSPHGRSSFDDDNDSTFEEDDQSTVSLGEECKKIINGREYTTIIPDVHSWTTTEDRSLEMMDIMHDAATKLFDEKLCQAPVMDGAQRVLDVGTGTGIWAIDFAESNPQAEVIGSDISTIQPPEVPPNLTIEIDDFNRSWTWKANHFDYIHLRNLAGNVPDWPHLFGQAFECLRPGGYLESHEQSLCFYSEDPSLNDPQLEKLVKAIETWNSIFRSMEEKLQRSFTVADDETHGEAMNKAGFVDLKRYYKPIPIGDWPKDGLLKEIGRFLQAALLVDLEGLLNYPATQLGWNFQQVVMFLVGVRTALQCRKLRLYTKVVVFVGRKPG